MLPFDRNASIPDKSTLQLTLQLKWHPYQNYGHVETWRKFLMCKWYFKTFFSQDLQSWDCWIEMRRGGGGGHHHRYFLLLVFSTLYVSVWTWFFVGGANTIGKKDGLMKKWMFLPEIFRGLFESSTLLSAWKIVGRRTTHFRAFLLETKKIGKEEEKTCWKPTFLLLSWVFISIGAHLPFLSIACFRERERSLLRRDFAWPD